MRFWIALFLISLFAFQALPLTAFGKGCLKAKIATSACPDEDAKDEDGPIPEAGKGKKSGQWVEDYVLHPDSQRIAKLGTIRYCAVFAPLIPMAPANGHAPLHTRPPDRH